MANVQCDKCQKYFDIKQREKKHGRGIVETYFTCPHCKAKYTAFVLNAEARRLQREIKGLTQKQFTASTEEEREHAAKDLIKSKEKLARLMEELKKQIR